MNGLAQARNPDDEDLATPREMRDLIKCRSVELVKVTMAERKVAEVCDDSGSDQI